MLQSDPKSEFSSGYNSVILKAIIMKILPRVQNCDGSLKHYFGNIFKKIFENRRFFIIEKRYY